MKKIVRYISLDVHEEIIGGGRERTDILAALPPSLRYGETGARRSRKVRDSFVSLTPGVARRLVVPGAIFFHPSGISKWPAARFRAAKRNEDGVRVLKKKGKRNYSAQSFCLLSARA